MESENQSRCENCIIRQLNALKMLSKEELKNISECKVTKVIQKGDIIFKEGEMLNGIFCVRKGVTKLTKGNDNGRNHIVKIASKGDVLGRRSIIANEKTNLSAQALDTMEVCYVPKKLILDSLNNNPKFTQATLETMAIELGFTENALVNMAQKTVPQRIAEALRYLEYNFGKDAEGYLNLILKREDIAGIVGTAKEACIRTLTTFKNKGYISTEGKRIKIEDDKALYRIVEGL